MPSRSQRKAHLSSREDSRRRIDGPYAPRQDRTFPCSASARPLPPHSHVADFLSIHAIPSCLQPVRLPVRNRFSPTNTETENLPDDRTSRDENTYAFAYDSFARLTDARHYEAGALTDRFAEKGLTYDANGNLRTLMRTGNGLTLNDLEYSYTGNRIASIADAGAVYDYGYDANGNMTHDGANDLDITYNCLNMTQKVEKKGTLSANYSYLADSTKLSATEPGGDGLYYSGSLVYGKRDGKLSLESAGFNGGRFVVTSNGIQTHLFVTDHLGSVRAVVDPASGEATETDDYYPFGLRWEDAEALISDNRYRYNGKEEQVFVGIPYVDFGFRMMDPEFRIGWNTADPKSEKYSGSSPYIYCGNDPIGNIDPDDPCTTNIIIRWDT